MSASRPVQPQSFSFPDDGSIPNHPRLPLLVYRSGLEPGQRSASACRRRFRDQGWTGNWVNGIYSYHHYHSTAHEVLGVVRGSARVQFGGPEGEILDVRVGDVVVIPAGVGHCRQARSGGFQVVGGYAGGRSWDMNTGKSGERPQVLENIRELPNPETDPLYGPDGPLLEIWE